MNAGRKYLKLDNLQGKVQDKLFNFELFFAFEFFLRLKLFCMHLKVFLTSGLGGMSGAQPKAAVISGCIGVVAEVMVFFQRWW